MNEAIFCSKTVFIHEEIYLHGFADNRASSAGVMVRFRKRGFDVVARKIKAPVLLIHGADDVETRPDHARRIFAALAGPKRLILVPGAGHNQSLQGDRWSEVERWIDSTLIAQPQVPGSGIDANLPSN